ncbi:MAG: HD domain-containing phosphohydrolase [Lachnotalea sp.]
MFKLLTHKIYALKSEYKYNDLKREGIKICFIYMLIGFVWIYFSDRIVHIFVMDPEVKLLLNTYKGFVYVILTAYILFLLISSLLRKVESAEKKLNENKDELTAANEELQAYVEEMLISDEELRIQYDKIVEYDKKLKLSENKYKSLISEMQLGLALYEGTDTEDVNNYKLIDVNSCHETLTGYKKKDILGKYFYQIHKNFEPTYLEKLNHTAKTSNPIQYERYQKSTDKFYQVIAYKPKQNQLAVIVNDITTRKLAEEKIKISENNFKNLFTYSSDCILLIDGEKIINCNSATTELLGYESKESLIGKSPLEFTPKIQPDGKLSKEKLAENLKICMELGKLKFEWWHEKKDGSLIPSEIMVTTINLDGKKIFHAACRDISDRKKMEEDLQYLSYHDQLTGLYNRRFFEQELIRLDREENYPLTITMADINGLKLINDSFGHAIGDEYIKKVAMVLTKGIRKIDTVCRLSGDEFIILSPNTEISEVNILINEINQLAKNESVKLVNISVSFGYCSKNSKEDSMIVVLKKAEDYMYKKKLFESPSMRGKTIYTVIATLHEKNPREEQHSLRVSELCEQMGIELGMQEGDIKELKTVGLLHDIGKIAIDESVLNKNGKLNEEEWEEVKKHPEIGYRILSTANELSEMANYVLAHHERWDGNGYPKGLKGEEIPIQAAIISIVDSYDAMVSERSYREALPKEYAVSELIKGAGTQFSPACVKVFVEKILHESYELA